MRQNGFNTYLSRKAISLIIFSICFVSNGQASEYNHSTPDYLNREVLYIQPNDLVLGKEFSNKRAVVFAYASLDDDSAAHFVDTLLPDLLRRQVPVVLRPRIGAISGVSMFRVAQCIGDEERAVHFLKSAIKNRSDWKAQRNVYPYAQKIAAQIGYGAAFVAQCLDNPDAFRALYAMEEFARKQNVLRKPPMPTLQIFINRHMFPGLVDNPVLVNTLWRAIEHERNKKPGELVLSLHNNMSGDITVGNPEAPVKIVRYDTPEFSALNGFINAQLPTLNERYIENGQISVTFRLYPWFDTGNYMVKLVHCAGDKKADLLRFVAANSHRVAGQDGFWNRKPQVEQDIMRQAIKMYQLQTPELTRCMSGNTSQKIIDSVRKVANEQLNYFYNPTIIINGQPYTKGLTLEEHIKIIDAALKQGQQ